MRDVVVEARINEQRRQVIVAVAQAVQKELDGAPGCHDWYHVERVWHLARHIACVEKADSYVVELTALLHDVADYKFHGGDDSAGPKKAGCILRACGLKSHIIEMEVCEIIARMSFKGAHVPDDMPTLEGKVVQDADYLDAIGAIGIARVFAYAGYKKRPLHVPHEAIERHGSAEAYKQNSTSAIGHFHEKLLLVKDRMKTKEGKRLARKRHNRLVRFLEDFHEERRRCCCSCKTAP